MARQLAARICCRPTACSSPHPAAALASASARIAPGGLPARLVWLAGGSIMLTGWLIAVVLIVVLMVLPLSVYRAGQTGHGRSPKAGAAAAVASPGPSTWSRGARAGTP